MITECSALIRKDNGNFCPWSERKDNGIFCPGSERKDDGMLCPRSERKDDGIFCPRSERKDDGMFCPGSERMFWLGKERIKECFYGPGRYLKVYQFVVVVEWSWLPVKESRSRVS